MWLSQLLTTVTRCSIQFSKYRCLLNELYVGRVGFVPREGNLTQCIYTQDLDAWLV